MLFDYFITLVLGSFGTKSTSAFIRNARMYGVTLYVHTLSVHIVFFAIFLQGVQFVSQAFKAVEV